ncbi:MAG: transglycosylase SLT domain-containing protein [Pseudomonadota bacterium]
MIKLGAIIAAVLVYLGFSRESRDSGTPEPVQSTAGWETEPVSFEKSTVINLDDLYKKHGQRHGIDWKLLKAIAQVESSENPLAKNQLDPSFGLMQLLCKPDGMGGCSNRLNVLDWPPVGDSGNPEKSKLFDPDYSLHIGAQILAWNIGQYGRNKGIAVYNAWSAHTAPKDGPYPNQGYVDKVLSKYRNLGGI